MVEKITAFEVLTAINEIRKLTCPPGDSGPKVVGIDQVVEADNLLLDLQEKLLDSYGDDSQSAILASS